MNVNIDLIGLSLMTLVCFSCSKKINLAGKYIFQSKSAREEYLLLKDDSTFISKTYPLKRKKLKRSYYSFKGYPSWADVPKFHEGKYTIDGKYLRLQSISCKADLIGANYLRVLEIVEVGNASSDQHEIEIIDQDGKPFLDALLLVHYAVHYEDQNPFRGNKFKSKVKFDPYTMDIPEPYQQKNGSNMILIKPDSSKYITIDHPKIIRGMAGRLPMHQTIDLSPKRIQIKIQSLPILDYFRYKNPNKQCLRIKSNKLCLDSKSKRWTNPLPNPEKKKCFIKE